MASAQAKTEVARTEVPSLLAECLIGAEREAESVGKFGPEFAHDIPGHSVADAQAHAAGSGPKASRIAGMVQVPKRFGTGGAQPLRVVEHGMAGVAASDKTVGQRVLRPRLNGSFAQ